MFEAYILNLLILIGIYIILGVSLNLVLGFTGLINLGHIALFGIGAYTSALLAGIGLPFFVAFFAAGLISGLFGFALIFATRKLKGDYFALATLGFAFVTYSLMLNLQELTRGPLGIAGISKPSIFGLALTNNISYFVFVYLVVVLTVIAIYSIVKSPFGKLLHAARNDEIGLRVLGKNTNKIKFKVMAVSGFFAGIAGSLFAHYISFIDPSSFYITEIILILSIVIVGGIASIQGTIAGTILIFLIPEILRFFDLPSGVLGASRQIIYAVILIGILLYKPRGLFGRIDLE
jgi:branched-chain amino acid transport system permease protein|tara:strand:- start:1801 stop:2673 length:873 start_codon:yes stop_codon:yes gene_type:complete